MTVFCSTYIIRHSRENLKKCSLRGLEKRSDFVFFTYPDCLTGKQQLPDFDKCLLLDLEGQEFSPADHDRPLILLDGTWRLAQKMARLIPPLQKAEKRRIPQGYRTAYPRCQHDCIDPTAGLASIEALYIAFYLLGRSTEGLLDGYYWKDLFLKLNNFPSNQTLKSL